MRKLRQSLLEQIRILGNHSGCHQLPERSFFYKGKQFPVCARCTGVCFGQSAALALLPFSFTLRTGVSFLFILIMGLDWFIQEIGFKQSNNIRRLVTGFLGGIGVFSLYIRLGKYIWKRIRLSLF